MTEDKKTGGYAFPNIGFTADRYGELVPQQENEGMTMRQYYAAEALKGLLANGSAGLGPQQTAKMAFKYADEMIKAENE